MSQANKQHELTINISPANRSNIITNTTFFTMDVKTAKKIINFTQNNEPVNLTDATVLLGFEFVGANASKIIDSGDGSVVIEEATEGKCSVILPNHIYEYEGQVLVHVYIKYEDGRSLDCGVIVTEFEESWLDRELPELSEFYVERFENLASDIKGRALEIEERLLEAEARLSNIENLQGPAGPQGIQGERGQTGPAGPQGIAGTTSWNDMTDLPTAFEPVDHDHGIEDVKYLQERLNQSEKQVKDLEAVVSERLTELQGVVDEVRNQAPQGTMIAKTLTPDDFSVRFENKTREISHQGDVYFHLGKQRGSFLTRKQPILLDVISGSNHSHTWSGVTALPQSVDDIINIRISYRAIGDFRGGEERGFTGEISNPSIRFEKTIEGLETHVLSFECVIVGVHVKIEIAHGALLDYEGNVTNSIPISSDYRSSHGIRMTVLSNIDEMGDLTLTVDGFFIHSEKVKGTLLVASDKYLVFNEKQSYDFMKIAGDYNVRIKMNRQEDIDLRLLNSVLVSNGGSTLIPSHFDEDHELAQLIFGRGFEMSLGVKAKENGIDFTPYYNPKLMSWFGCCVEEITESDFKIDKIILYKQSEVGDLDESSK